MKIDLSDPPHRQAIKDSMKNVGEYMTDRETLGIGYHGSMLSPFNKKLWELRHELIDAYHSGSTRDERKANLAAFIETSGIMKLSKKKPGE